MEQTQKSGLEVQKQIDDFILESGIHRTPEMQKYLFRKLYDQKGQDDEVREILDAAFDFSKQKNCCAAMKIGEYLCCGEPCEGMFCYKHLLQMEGLGIIPGPCKCCGIGIDKRSTYCSPCVLETGERERGRRLAKEFEDEEAFGGKNRCAWYEGENGFCGKPCVGPACFKHMLMGLAGHEPAPFNLLITN